MSEAAPGHPDSAKFVSEQRARVAEATRALVDALMTTPDTDDTDLAAAADAVEAVVHRLVGDRPPRAGGPGYFARDHSGYLPRSPVVGAASPLAPGTIDWEILDDPDRPGTVRMRATGVMTAAYEGPPTYVHGGFIALVFDEVLGIVNIANESPGMTGSLSIRYRRPTPLFQPLVWEAWVEKIEGRRVVSRAHVLHDGNVCAEAEGLFIQPNEETRARYFAAALEAEAAAAAAAERDGTR